MALLDAPAIPVCPSRPGLVRPPRVPRRTLALEQRLTVRLTRTIPILLATAAAIPTAPADAPAENTAQPVYPAAEWARRTPEQVGLSAEKLKALAELAGGRGCVVRHGYLVHTWGDPAKGGDIASAVKPVISTLLLLVVQDGKLPGVDAKVSDFEPGLLRLILGTHESGTIADRGW